MTDEVQQAEMPDSGLAAPEIPDDQETVDTGATPDVAEETEGEQPDAQEKPKGGFQRRIKELADERNEYRRALRVQDERIDQLVSLLGQQARPQDEKPAEPAAIPTLEQYQYDEAKYQAAIREFMRVESRREAADEARKIIHERDLANSERERRESFAKRESEFAAKTPDYRERVYDDYLPISQVTAELIRESEYGPQIAYHLAQHRDLAVELSRLGERQVAREIGRLESRFSAPPTKPAAVPQAPPPPPRVEAVEPEIERDPDKMDINDWVKWREKQIRKKQGR